VVLVIFTLCNFSLLDVPIVSLFLQVIMASYSWSSSDGSSGRGVEVPRDDGSVSSFPLSLLETEGSLGRGSSGSSSPVNSNNEDGLG